MNEEKLVEHHVKYKEIHGYDETVWMTDSEHKKLHHRLRREGGCNIPVDELRKISQKAHYRTKKCKEACINYRNSKQGKMIRAMYNQSEHGKKVRNDYFQSEHSKKLRRKSWEKYKSFDFSESPGLNTEFRERIVYNYKNGSVKYYARFCGHSPYKLVFIDI